MSNEILEKSLKAMMLGEIYKPGVDDYINSLISTLESIRPSNVQMHQRLQLQLIKRRK
jgi:hypothetical protein